MKEGQKWGNGERIEKDEGKEEAEGRKGGKETAERRERR